jgi:ComF family protein
MVASFTRTNMNLRPVPGSFALQLGGIARAGLDMVFPRTCASCGRPAGEPAAHLCWDCLVGLWPIQSPHCTICGNPVSGAIAHDYKCSFCVARQPRFNMARSAVHYDGSIVPVLQAFKYRSATYLSRDLSMIALACARTHYAMADIDAVTFVPLHSQKQRERSYNQSQLIAAELARMIDKPILGRCLARARPTVSQTTLSSKQRRDNVRGAFEAVDSRWLAGKRLLLVDDVMTTGATLDECAAVLKKAGAAEVSTIAIARGVR